jgi:hypothetical protein
MPSPEQSFYVSWLARANAAPATSKAGKGWLVRRWRILQNKLSAVSTTF